VKYTAEGRNGWRFGWDSINDAVIDQVAREAGSGIVAHVHECEEPNAEEASAI
jgi:hypothetical protein